MSYEMRYCGGRWVGCDGKCHQCVNTDSTTSTSGSYTMSTSGSYKENRPADVSVRRIKANNIANNAYEEGYERGRFDALDAISSVYYGKQYYFLEDNGTVYSRDSCKYLTLEEAIYEFADKFGDDGVGY